MPQAVTHVLIPSILASIIRDRKTKKNKRKFPLHYVLIAGIAGLLPDIDVIAFWGLYFFGFTIEEVHRNFTHTIFVPLLFLALYYLFGKMKIRELGKHKLRLNLIFLMISFGSFVHLILDAFLTGKIMPFYPLFKFGFGLNLVGYLPLPLSKIAIPCLDAALLVLWMIYLEVKHKISDFI
jgi:membrane-bound metal-dependent hydrolase YbcI (DUF457 family)